jgi:hypothetical protein
MKAQSLGLKDNGFESHPSKRAQISSSSKKLAVNRKLLSGSNAKPSASA